MALNSNFRTQRIDNIEGIVGEKNYLRSGFENGQITGWTELSVTLASGLPSGAPTISSTAATSIALSTTTTTPLSGKYSLLVAANLGLTAGHGFISDSFFIDRMDAGKVLTVSFDYERVNGTVDFSGTLGLQTWMVYVYDVTSASWVQPAGFLGMNQSSGPGRVSCTFQTSTATNQAYRIAVIASQPVAGASSIEFDNFACSRQTAPIGPVVTDWVSYTPTITNLNAGTTPSQFYRWRRVGDSINIIGNVTAGGAGIGASGQVSFTIPSGLSFDTSKLAIISETTIGTGSIHDSGSARLPCSVNASNSTSFHLVVRSNAATGGNIVSTNEPSAGWWNAAGDSISFELTAPISGWSSNVQLSNDTDTRVVAFAANKTAAQSIPNNSYTVIDFNSVEINTHGSTYAAGAYTAPVSGYYRVGFNFNFASGSGGTIFALLNKNGAGFSRVSTQPFATSQSGGTGTTVLYLNAGENVSLSVIQLSGAAQNLEGAGRFSVERISGPSVVAASETVAMGARNSSGQSIPNNSSTTITNWTEMFDTHDTFNPTTGLYTVPVSGKYLVSGGVGFLIAALSAGNQCSLQIQKNGSDYQVLGGMFAQSSVSTPMATNGSVELQCVAGDVLRLQSYQSMGGARSLIPDVNWNYFSIVRVGN